MKQYVRIPGVTRPRRGALLLAASLGLVALCGPVAAQEANWPSRPVKLIVTFPPERVMSALAPLSDDSPPLQPEGSELPDEKRRPRHKPIMSAGTGS